MERRRSLRIFDPFPATVRATSGGRPVRFATVLDNICSGGLHFHLPPALCGPPPGPVTVGATLSLDVRFAPVTADADGPAPRVALRGEVLRVERRDGGACGVGVAIRHFKFL